MAITVDAAPKFSWTLDQNLKAEYHVVATAGESDANVGTAFQAALNTTLQGLGNRVDSLELVYDDGTVKQFTGTATWSASARSTGPSRATGDYVYSFDVGLETVRITQSLQTVNKYPAATAEDFSRAIGVTREGGNVRVEGVDVEFPYFTWTEAHYLSNATVSAAYRSTIANLVGKLNAAPFRVAPSSGTTFAAGTVKLLGCPGTQRANDWEVAFKFGYRPDTSFDVQIYGGGVETVVKPGWAYVWSLYEDVVGTSQLVKRPISVYVERVFETGDFSTLGI